MGVRDYRELIAWQLADAFTREVFALVRQDRTASWNRRFRDQILAAAAAAGKDIAEGFLRCSPGEMVRFLNYAIGSLAEAELHVRDGAELGYYTEADCREALTLAKRCTVAVARLRTSQKRYARLKAQGRRQSD